MHTLAENNVHFSFQSSSIINIELGKTGFLSTHIIRELGVYSKVKNGHYAKAYIINIDSTGNKDENLWQVCGKAERFAPDVLVAIVYPQNALQANLQNFRISLKPAGRVQVFASHAAALIWIENKLHNTFQLNLTQTPELAAERIA